MFDTVATAPPPETARAPSDVLGELDAAATLARAHDAQREENLVQAGVLQIAAHWADLHGVLKTRADDHRALPGMERLVVVGGEGTPAIAEFCCAELGTEMGTSDGAARNLIADALDLRHRLPRLWERLCAGDVKRWIARNIAKATRDLSPEACSTVDARLTPWVDRVAWPRLEAMLEAAVIAADPDAAEERAAADESNQGVWVYRGGTHGTKKIFIRTGTAAATLFKATIDRIAEDLRLGGDTSPIDQRRATAVGIMAQPQACLQLFDQTADAVAGSEEGDQVSDEYDLHSPDPEPEPAGTDGPSGSTAETKAIVRHPMWDTDPEKARVVRHIADSLHGQGLAEDAVTGSRMMCRCGCHSGQRVDPAKLRPRATLYVHVSAEALSNRDSDHPVARIEGEGPVTLEQARRFLRHCHVTLKPVVDPLGQTPTDSYEIPRALTEAVRLLSPADSFPYGGCTTRGMDIDHTDPYVGPDKGGPPDQTRIGNLAPLTRRHHRIKTFGEWLVRQPFPGILIWRSPHGHHYLVDNSGTRRLN